MKDTRLSGHGLLYEGRTRGWYRSETMGPGPAICSCGAESPPLPTTAERKRWHAQHKDAVRNPRKDL